MPAFRERRLGGEFDGDPNGVVAVAVAVTHGQHNMFEVELEHACHDHLLVGLLPLGDGPRARVARWRSSPVAESANHS